MIPDAAFNRLVLARLIEAVLEDQHRILVFAGLGQDVGEELDGVGGFDPGQHKGQQLRAPAFEALGGEVRHIVELVYGCQDALARGFSDPRFAIDNARYGFDGNIRSGSNAVNRRHEISLDRL